MAEDLENSKWLEIHIGMMSTSTGIISSKKMLNEYAEELGWDVEVDKKGIVAEDGQRRYSLNLQPKDKKISPEEFRENVDKIAGFAYAIGRDITANNNEEIPNSVTYQAYLDPETKKDRLHITIFDMIIIDCDLKKAIKLELENPNLFKAIFQFSIKKWHEENLDKKDKIFLGEEERRGAQQIVRVLEDNGIPRSPNYKKKNFFQRLF